jgi:hypothetical protein
MSELVRQHSVRRRTTQDPIVGDAREPMDGDDVSHETAAMAVTREASFDVDSDATTMSTADNEPRKSDRVLLAPLPSLDGVLGDSGRRGIDRQQDDLVSPPNGLAYQLRT